MLVAATDVGHTPQGTRRWRRRHGAAEPASGATRPDFPRDGWEARSLACYACQMAEPARSYVSFEDFLLAEAADATGVRREWMDGLVHDMAGASPEHGRLCTAMLADLRAALRGKCTVRDGSVAIHIASTRAGLRPDASVVCGSVLKTVVEKNGRSEGEALTNPCLLVEVLSSTTERDDRGWKFRDYRSLPSLEEYVLVAQDTRRIEIYRRASGWEPEVVEAGGMVVLHGAAIALEAIYD